jgi:rubrerythrin
MTEHKTDRERVEFALKTEQDGHEFYQMACMKVANKLARAAFRLLGKEELRHAELIEGLGKQLGGEGEVPTIETVTRKALESGLKTIYGSAQEGPVEEEMDSVAAYEKAIELVGVLLKEEEHHLSLLEDMHTYLTKPEEWFIDREGIILDGG